MTRGCGASMISSQKGGVWVNGVKAGGRGLPVQHGDLINIAGESLRFHELSHDDKESYESVRTAAGQGRLPAVTLFELTLFQLALLLQHCLTSSGEQLFAIALAFFALIGLEWCCYNAMRVMNRSGFEIETIAFYLTTLGMSVAASSTPDDMYKQIVLTIAAVLLFLLMGWWLRKLGRTAAARIPIAALAVLLMAVNIVASDAVLGARNWLEFGGFSFQPSELVKVGYIYAGASTLDRLYRRNNLYTFIGFSAFCVIALALIGDFGTALIFFATFLVISLSALRFHRNGAPRRDRCGACGLSRRQRQAPILPSASPHGGMRGRIYMTRASSRRAPCPPPLPAACTARARAAAGSRTFFAANTDMVFAVICEEQGAYNRAHNGARGAGAGFLRRAQRAARALGVLFHRRLRRDEHAARAACAQCFRLARPAAVYGSYLPVRLPRRRPRLSPAGCSWPLSKAPTPGATQALPSVRGAARMTMRLKTIPRRVR